MNLRTSAMKAAVFGLGLVAATGSYAQAAGADKDTIPGKIIHRINPDQPTNESATAGSTGEMTPPIAWNGGPVLKNSPNIYVIWYGSWNQSNGSDTPAGQQIVRDFLYGLSGSPYLLINGTYYDGSGYVSGYTGNYTETSVGYPYGSKLKDSTITKIVSNYMSSSGNKDTNALYYVLTSSDVAETSGFCSRYCGWHTNGTIQGLDIKYSFVGNANRCLSACSAQSTGPNGNAGVDGMVSVMAHELDEALTDPDPPTGWTDSSGSENGDKCAWTFGSAEYQVANGAWANMSLPAKSVTSRDYLIQRDLKATDSKCYVNIGGQQ